MTFAEQMITIVICVLGTMTTRFLPFLIFTEGRPTPPAVHYLGKALPSVAFGMLVIYCLKDVQFTLGTYGFPEAIAITATVILHSWKRQMLLSIAGGTLVYMMLVQFVF